MTKPSAFKLTFLTLFPNYYQPFISESIIARAIERGLVTVDVIDWRKFSPFKHHQVDDTVYGGGSGMLLMVEPLDRALATLSGYRVLLSPQGKPFTQAKAAELAAKGNLVLIAGHYEGFDERVRSLIDEEVSIGDYVLTGGELPSLIVADAVIRLVQDVIKPESLANESFQANLLDYPQYTKPQVYKGMAVPEVLLSGNHKEIAKWRRSAQIKKTRQVRPDLVGGKEVKNEN